MAKVEVMCGCGNPKSKYRSLHCRSCAAKINARKRGMGGFIYPKCGTCFKVLAARRAKYCNKCKGAAYNSGNKHYKWIEDRSKIKRQLERNNPNDKQWKLSVYRRDKFKCKMSNPDCKGQLEAHHILSWREYPELRYEINNGITLCRFHHPLKEKDEKELSPYFQKLVKEMQ